MRAVDRPQSRREDTSTRGGVGLATVVGVAIVVATLGLAAGCSKGHGAATTTPSSSLPVVTSSGPASSPAPSPSTSAPPSLPVGCSQLLPLQAVQQALGVGVPGKVTYLRAAPVPASGRTGRVTCGYGVPIGSGASGSPSASPTGPPLVEVSYITYTDAKTAAGRVSLTVQHDGQTATITKVTVGGQPAWVLVGKQWNELLMADGARTLVVEVSPSILPAAKAPAALSAMAAKMLQFGASAGASGGASAGASGSPAASS